MKKVASCLDKLTDVFEALLKADSEKMEKLVVELSALEHEADVTKNDIRNHLPKSLFMPIDRSHFLEILSIQDSIADKAEDIGLLLVVRPLEKFKDFPSQLQAFYKKGNEVFIDSKRIIAEIDELLESSFGGIEAEKVKGMVEQVAYKEHETDCMHRELRKQLFTYGDSLSAPSFYLWLKLLEEIADLAGLSEKLANRIRMVLELK
jgi:hypothetical protein